MILLEEWGTSGKKRATVGDLLNLLVHVELFRAADFVAEDLLAETRPARSKSGPSVPFPIIDPTELELQGIDSFIARADYPDTSVLQRNENRSYLNNRVNSQSDCLADLVKPMEGIGLSTRDDNLPDFSGIVFNVKSDLNDAANSSDVTNSSDTTQTNGTHTTKSAYSTNGDISEHVPNGSVNAAGREEDTINESNYLPNLADLMDQTADSSAIISITPMTSTSDLNDDRSTSTKYSHCYIPNLSELYGTKTTNGDSSMDADKN